MAEQKRVFQPEAINVNEFVYSPPHPNQSGTITNIYMNYNKTRPLIQSPMMFCPFGISVMEDKQPEGKKGAAVVAAPKRDPGYSVDLQLGSENPRLEAFTQWLEALDVRTLADCQKNSSLWMKHLKGKLTPTIAQELFKPLVKKYFDADKCIFTDKYPARCKFKLQRKNGNFTTRVFDHNRNLIDINSMGPKELKNYGKGMRMRIIFEVGGIWTGQKGFGITLKADQIMLYPAQKLTGFGFLDDVEDELIFGTMAGAPAPPIVAAVAPAPSIALPPPPAAVAPEPVEASTEEEPAVQTAPNEENEEHEEQEPNEGEQPSPPKAKKGAAKQTTLTASSKPKKPTTTKSKK